MTARTLLVLTLLVPLLALAYLLLWPVDVEPNFWEPPPAPPLTGAYAPNEHLAGAERLADGQTTGPEDIAIDSQGRACAGLEHGQVLCLDPNGGGSAALAHTGGRPLGLDFDADGNLIVADALKGLLSASPDGRISVLAVEEGGRPFRFTNDLDVATDGTIYFSDSSYLLGPSRFIEAIIEHGSHGRLLAYDPKSGDVRRLLDDLFFANGVAVSPDQSFVLVVETGAYRVRRYWLKGPDAGRADIFIDNLPGFPDGISSNGRGMFWLTLYAPRSAVLDRLMPWPSLRKILLRLPIFLYPEPRRYGFVLGLDLDGRIVRNLQDPAGGYAPVSSVEEYDGWLYLGSREETAIGRVRLATAVSTIRPDSSATEGHISNPVRAQASQDK